MTGVTAILPVRRWDHSKSRLQLSPVERALLARAFSLDVLQVLLDSEAVDRVVIVTDEPQLMALDSGGRIVVVRQRGRRRHRRLKEAVALGIDWARNNDANTPVLVVPADLASLTVGSLLRALDRLRKHPLSYVPDLSGSGITLLYASRAAHMTAAYGRGSVGLHERAGYVACFGPEPRVRLDIDSLTDLRGALVLGVGPETSRWCSSVAPQVELIGQEVDLDRRILAAMLLWA